MISAKEARKTVDEKKKWEHDEMIARDAADKLWRANHRKDLIENRLKFILIGIDKGIKQSIDEGYKYYYYECHTDSILQDVLTQELERLGYRVKKNSYSPYQECELSEYRPTTYSIAIMWSDE